MARKILMLCGDYAEDYETMVPFQALLALGRIPADTAVAIRSLDAQAVLHALPRGWGRPAAASREPA